MIFRSNVKVNIGLKVIGIRSDGYHNISTIFQELDCGDILKIHNKNDFLGLFLLFKSILLWYVFFYYHFKEIITVYKLLTRLKSNIYSPKSKNAKKNKYY